MKIIRIANKTKIILTKSEWIFIGKAFERKANLQRMIKSASLFIETQNYPYYLTIEEFVKRLKKCGWTSGLNAAGDNYFSFINTRDGSYYSLASGKAAWDVTNGWRQNYRHLRAQCPDLASFIFEHDFEIPTNFDVRTQRFATEIEPVYDEKNVPFAQIPYDEIMGKKYEIMHDGEWHYIEDIDFGSNMILLDNGSIISLSSPTSLVIIRKKV